MVGVAGLVLLAPFSMALADELGENKSAFSRALTAGNYTKAVDSGEKVVAEMRKQEGFGSDFESIAYLQAFAFASGQVGETGKADQLFEEALGFARAFDRKGGTPPQEAIALLKWANHRTDSKRPVEAELLFDEALEIQEKVHGKESEEFAEVLNNRGVLRERIGKFDGALADLEEAYRIRAAAGEGSPGALDSQWNLAYTTFRSGQMERALERLGSYIAVALPRGGGEAARAVEAMELRARILRESGDGKEAREAYEKGRTAARELFGAESSAEAKFLRGLAKIDEKDSDLESAAEKLMKAIAIYEAKGNSGDPEATSMRTDLAGVYQKQGRMREAVPMLEAVLRDLKAAATPDHDRLANTFTALGICYGRIGDLDNARDAMFSALEQNGLSGASEEAPERLVLMSNIANILIQAKDYERAAELQENVLALRESSLEADNPYIAESLESLAMSYENLDRDDEAEKLYLRAIAINEKRAGSESLQTAGGLNNLADFYRTRGQYDKAVAIGTRVLAIIRKLFGDQHRYTATSYENLGFAQFGAGDHEGALESLRGSIASSEAELADVLAFGTEQQRLEYLASRNPWTLPASLGAARELATLRLRQKGLARDSLIEDRLLAARSKDPAVAAAMKEVAKAKSTLRQSLGDKTDAAAITKATEALHGAERALTDATRRKSTAREALDFTLEDLRAAIPKDTVFVDFLSYKRFVPGGESTHRFDAVVIRGDAPPVFVPCAEADAIAPLVETYLLCAAEATDDETTVEVCRALYGQLIAPLVPHFGEGTKRLVLSPDGPLHRLSFATLMPDDASFLGSRYALQYADSARDLLVTPSVEATAKKSLVLVGDAAFGDGALAPLPATRREVGEIEELAKGRDWNVTALLGAGATEAGLREAPAPTLLHLATHGFYLGDDTFKGARVGAMFRSGIALSGASATLDAWKEGTAPDAAGDGIITADEVADLDCSGTWLVTLSACDSGTGKLENGEGVIGLRRGFALAGAENVLMTLWPVRSEETASLMTDFYKAALAGGDAAAALRETQQSWLENLLRDKGALRAVATAGPFILAQRGAIAPVGK